MKTRIAPHATLGLAPAFAPLALSPASIAGGAPVNLLVNGSFEEPDLGGASFVYTVAPGWAHGEDGSMWLFNRPDPTPDVWPSAHDGVQYADIGNAPAFGSLRQTVTVPDNGVYALSWWNSTASSIAGTGATALYTVSIVDDNEAVVYRGDFAAAWGSPGFPWAPGGTEVFLASGTYSIQFLPTNPPFTWDVLIDDVWFSPFAGVCGSADLAPPFGLLDLTDVNAFAAGFVGMDPVADLNADGLFDLGDINLFVTAFNGGCP